MESMRNPFIGAVQWVVRHIVSFIIIVIILVIGDQVRDAYHSLEMKKQEITKLASMELQVRTVIENLRLEARDRVTRLKDKSKVAIDSRIGDIDREIIEVIKSADSSVISAVLKPEILIKQVESKAKIELLESERKVLLALLEKLKENANLSGLKVELEKASRAIQENRSNFEKMKNDALFYRETKTQFFSSAVIGLNGLNDDYKKRLADYQTNKDSTDRTYQKLQQLNRQIEVGFQNLGRFKSSALLDLQKNIEKDTKDVRENWISKVLDPARDKIIPAIGILVGLIFSPLIIKALFYFVIAPFAARRPPVCILPETNGLITDVDGLSVKPHETQKVSSVSIPITLRTSEELLIHPEYLQSTPTNGKIRTKWLLDWAYPFTSMAAGMVALTQIAGVDGEAVVISSTNDPLSEVGVVTIPAGSSVVLQPHCLIGIVYQNGTPPRITKHWRLSSLHAWLTLQLRYLVFHGPVNIALKGCRGIRIEAADSRRVINQAATMGFSANLKYSTYRCETFSSYLLGEKELFNDSFSGESGYYIYEEMPHFGKKGGVTGRGLEGVTDSVLKVFGV